MSKVYWINWIGKVRQFHTRTNKNTGKKYTSFIITVPSHVAKDLELKNRKKIMIEIRNLTKKEKRCIT